MDYYNVLVATAGNGPFCWIQVSVGTLSVSTPNMNATQARELAAKLTACADEMEAQA